MMQAASDIYLGWTKGADVRRHYCWRQLLLAPAGDMKYLGRSDAFDRSITDFGERYADQNERDYDEFVSAVRSGRLEAVEGV
jgi:hypothetical protein